PQTSVDRREGGTPIVPGGLRYVGRSQRPWELHLAGVPARLDELGRNGPSDPPAGHGQVGQNPSMGRWRAPLLSGRSTGGRALTDADVPAALRVCAQVPVDSVLAASRIATAAEVGLRRAGGTLWGFERDDELVAVCWSGANLV